MFPISQIILIVAVIAAMASAFPSLADCNGAGWTVGANANAAGMGLTTPFYQDGNTAGDCVISGVPPVYQPCNSYEITVTSGNNQRGMKLQVSIGKLFSSKNSAVGTTNDFRSTNNNCRDTGDNVVAGSSKYVWTAPNTVTAGNPKFFALCGNQNEKIFTAARQNNSVNASADPFLSGCPTGCLGSGCAALGNSGSIASTTLASVVASLLIALALLM